mgnify:CR=1 FL=1
MSKIRINELARELEVKPSAIIDALPELGVQDKKTHSSSIDDDLALLIRTHMRNDPNVVRYRIEDDPHADLSGGDEPMEAVAPPPPPTAAAGGRTEKPPGRARRGGRDQCPKTAMRRY